MNWEYKTIGLNSRKEDHLNELGAQGWELMFIEQGVAYFKRSKGISVVAHGVTNVINAPSHPPRERLKNK